MGCICVTPWEFITTRHKSIIILLKMKFQTLLNVNIMTTLSRLGSFLKIFPNLNNCAKFIEEKVHYSDFFCSQNICSVLHDFIDLRRFAGAYEGGRAMYFLTLSLLHMRSWTDKILVVISQMVINGAKICNLPLS